MYPAVFLIYSVSAAVILSASLALMFQFSLLYNNSWKDCCTVFSLKFTVV